MILGFISARELDDYFSFAANVIGYMTGFSYISEAKVMVLGVIPTTKEVGAVCIVKEQRSELFRAGHNTFNGAKVRCRRGWGIDSRSRH
jgi:hypothetical protein